MHSSRHKRQPIPRLTGPETSDLDFELWENELAEVPMYVRRLGSVALEKIQIDLPHNNDPLAHVAQLARNKGIDRLLLEKFKAEFITDIGERSPDSGHYHIFSMRVLGDDLISSTGISMRTSLQSSVDATRNDVAVDQRRAYGLERELVQQAQLDRVINWSQGASSGEFMGFASLCPGVDELPAEDAKVNGFKPERQHASLWFYEKTFSGLHMHALSLDHCTLDRFQRVIDTCAIDHEVGSTTMEELGKPISFDHLSIEELQMIWQQVLEHDGIVDKSATQNANESVESHPEAFKTYMEFVVDVTASLGRGVVNKNLAKLLRSVRKSKGAESLPVLNLRRFRRFSSTDARDLMDFVRSRMIPHYVFGDGSTRSMDSVDGVLSASGGAAMRVESYDGACPTSSFATQTVELGAMSSHGIVSRQLVVDKIMSDKRRGSCSTCGLESTTIYGCGLCGRCSKIWCDEYKTSGKGLGLKQIAKIVGKKQVKKQSKKST